MTANISFCRSLLAGDSARDQSSGVPHRTSRLYNRTRRVSMNRRSTFRLWSEALPAKRGCAFVERRCGWTTILPIACWHSCADFKKTALSLTRLRRRCKRGAVHLPRFRRQDPVIASTVITCWRRVGEGGFGVVYLADMSSRCVSKSRSRSSGSVWTRGNLSHASRRNGRHWP